MLQLARHSLEILEKFKIFLNSSYSNSQENDDGLIEASKKQPKKEEVKETAIFAESLSLLKKYAGI